MTDATESMLLFGAGLFSIGLVGFLTRRSMILMFLSLEMMLAGVSMNLIAFSKQHQNYQGQVLAIMILTIAACEAAIALAMVVSLYRRKATLDVFAWSDLNETPMDLFRETKSVIVEETLEYPKLTPAGLDPATQPIPADLDQATWSQPDARNNLASEMSQNA